MQLKTDSEYAPKRILNLKNFPNHLGKSGTKTHFAIVTEGNPVGCQICHLSAADDDDTADINATDGFDL